MKLLRCELTKLLLQRRTYVGWIGVMIIPALIVLALAFAGDSSGPGGEDGGPSFFALAGDNGLLVPLAAMIMLGQLFLPLLASMAGGYQLAGEAESGTIKTWLVHPVERGGVLASKWLTTVLYIFAGLALVAAVSYGAGIVAFGATAPELLSGGTVSVAQGLWLTLLAYLYVGVAMVCVASVAMLFSTITNSSLTAAIGTLVLVIALQIVGALSYFDFLEPYLFTTYFETWQGLFQESIDWAPLLKGLAAFAAYAGVTMGASWYVFRRKDIAV